MRAAAGAVFGAACHPAIAAGRATSPALRDSLGTESRSDIWIGKTPGMEAIEHVDLVVSDLDRSLAFYRELLRPLGYMRAIRTAIDQLRLPEPG